ncbi:MAG TPA: hypothetical protein VKO67_07350, partial [Smithellaceae bacterium]|nr:hypothetical protein [Smithellaceae bacterium]
MKKFGLFFLLFGLTLVFSTAAGAVDVKISGEYYAAGMYLDRTTLKKDVASEGPSTAFFFQRLRVLTDFNISPGLKLITRFDALERSWGATRSAATSSSYNSATGVITTSSASYDTASSGTRAENENIALDWAYIHYVSPVGLFRVGFMNDNAWGTVFADGATPKGKIMWSYTQGSWLVTLGVVKMFYDKSYSVVNSTTTASDVDNDKYVAAVKYTWKSGE